MQESSLSFWILILAIVSGAGAGIGTYKFYENISQWAPSSDAQPMRFHAAIDGKDIGVSMQLSPDGVLAVNLPLVYKVWQKQIDDEKKAKKK